MQRGKHQILIGDCRETLRTLSAGSVHCVCTSPPYFGLRDYGVDGQIGLEPTPEDFIDAMVQVYREVWRVLRDDGVCWINLGDSYNASPGQRKANDVAGPKQQTNVGAVAIGSRSAEGYKPGDLMNIPHRVAAALQADGWYWRSTIVWAKRSPMPESVSGWRWVPCRVKLANGAVARWGMSDLEGKSTDKALHALWTACPGCPKCSANDGLVLRRGRWRPTNAHEYIFLMTKGERYFCDGDAVQEVAAYADSGRQSRARGYFSGKNDLSPPMAGRESFRAVTQTRNPRNVWTLSSEPFKGSHFATFPSEIPRRAIQASTSAGGCCAACGAQYAPIVSSERVPTRPGITNQIDVTGMANRDPQRHVAVTRVSGYRATCGCNADTKPCVVLDPFLGSGTTLQVATHMGRDGIGCELNPEYAEMAERRINTPWQPKSEKKPKAKRKRREAREQSLLFEN